jgi:hypothetical protein
VFLLIVGQGKNTKPGSAENEAKAEGPAFAVRALSRSRSLYRLQSDFVSAAAQEGVEPEPPFLCPPKPLRKSGWSTSGGQATYSVARAPTRFPEVGRSSRAHSGLPTTFETYVCEE